MSRSVHGVDPERVRRAAAAYVAGECDLESAVQRAGCHPDSVSRMASKIRKERGIPAPVPVPPPRRAPVQPGAEFRGPLQTQRKNTRRAAIAVGDEVRIVRTSTARLHGAVGKVVHVERSSYMPYRVKVDGDSFAWWCYEVARIPRPVAAQGFSPGERVVWRPTPGSPWASLAIDGEVVSVRGDDRRVWTMRVLAVAGEVPNNLPPPIGSVLDLTAAPGRVERVPTCGPGCGCGDHDPLKPTPALVDGLTRDACLARRGGIVESSCD